MVGRELKFAFGTFFFYVLYSCFWLHHVSYKTSLLTTYDTLGFVSISLLLSRLPHFDVTKRAGLLGTVFGTGITFALYMPLWGPFGWYLAALSFFHFSEYVMTALYNEDKLSVDSFLLNHSFEYAMAALASWVEFLVEFYFVPGMKSISFVNILGLCMVVIGESLRKAAMVTAKSNFTHLVQYKKRDQHILVTWGIYGWCRHPSYVGWFWWSVGTQLVLCNPICCIAYTYASWNFFKERIHEEELTLLQFFGVDYIKYQKKVGTGIPFISGFIIDENIAH